MFQMLPCWTFFFSGVCVDWKEHNIHTIYCVHYNVVLLLLLLMVMMMMINVSYGLHMHTHWWLDVHWDILLAILPAQACLCLLFGTHFACIYNSKLSISKDFKWEIAVLACGDTSHLAPHFSNTLHCIHLLKSINHIAKFKLKDLLSKWAICGRIQFLQDIGVRSQ